MIHVIDVVLIVGCFPSIGTPERGEQMVVSNQILKEIIKNAESRLGEVGPSGKEDPLDRMKTMSSLIGNRGVVLAKQYDSIESISRHAKDLYTDELDAYEGTLNMILRDALEAKHDLMLLRRNIGRCSRDL